MVVALLAVVLGLAFWRLAGREGAKHDAPVVQRKGVAGTTTGSAVTPKRQDPRTLQRGSLAGTITDKATKQPLAGARVCVDGWSHDAPGDVFKDPTCADTDA